MIDVKQIHQDLSEVDPSSLQEWVDDFRRDEHPDKEIAIWKHIDNVYVSTVKGRVLSLKYKKEVFILLNICSMAPRAEAIAHSGLTVLSNKEANAIMDQFYANDFKSSPITIGK